MTVSISVLLNALETINGKPPVAVQSGMWTATCPACQHARLVVAQRGHSVSLSCDSGCDTNAVRRAIDEETLAIGANPEPLSAVTPTPDRKPSRSGEFSEASRMSEFSEASRMSEFSEVSLEISGISNLMGYLESLGASGGTEADERLMRAIQESQPTGKRQNLNRLAFNFVRHLKSVPGLKRSWGEVEQRVEAVIDVWHDLAGAHAPDKEEFRLEVFDIWDNVKTSIDDSPLVQAIEVAQTRPYRLEELGPVLSIIAALCRELADEDGLFFLSGQNAADAASP